MDKGYYYQTQAWVFSIQRSIHHTNPRVLLERCSIVSSLTAKYIVNGLFLLGLDGQEESWGTQKTRTSSRGKVRLSFDCSCICGVGGGQHVFTTHLSLLFLVN